MMDFLDQTFWNNTVLSYLKALGILIIGIIIIKVFILFLIGRLKKWSEKTKTAIDDMLIKLIKKTIVPLLYFASFLIAVYTLKLTDTVESYLRIATVLIITFFIIRLIVTALRFGVHKYLDRQDHAEEKKRQMRGILSIVNFLIWIVGFVFIMDNLGFQITAVIAGLGIGGIAIALAAQAILGDLFSYFVIFFDRPFEIGDFIKVDDKVGVVDHIGIKTSRIQSLSGEQLVFSNTDLTNSRVHNFKKMTKRRVAFMIGVTYNTPADKLIEAQKIIKEVIEKQPDAAFDRAHFFQFGDFSLNYEIVYYVDGSDYVKYMDIQQNINIDIYKRFGELGIEFAFPTQTIFMNKQG